MRFLLLAIPPLLVACSTSAPTPMLTPSDTGGSTLDGSDAGDGGTLPSYEASQFERFEYYWYGTGVTEKYSVDRDCGISGQTYGAPSTMNTGEGVVAATDCKSFAELTVSPETMAIMTGATPCEFGVSDDYANLSLNVAATKYERHLAGCTDHPPFSHLKDELRRLYGLYAKPIPSDAGTDATGD